MEWNSIFGNGMEWKSIFKLLPPLIWSHIQGVTLGLSGFDRDESYVYNF